jgi:hypothetical protein
VQNRNPNVRRCFISRGQTDLRLSRDYRHPDSRELIDRMSEAFPQNLGQARAPLATAGMAALGPLLLIFAATCSFYVVIAPLLVGHTDLGWHLAAGDLIRSEGSVPAHDPWSYTAGATRWYNHTWLWDVIASLLFQHGGFTALILAAIFFGGVIAVSLGAICLAGNATPIATCVAVISAGVLYPTYAIPDIFLAASPNIVTLLFCVTFYGACLNRRHLWLAPASMILWANMHGGFVLGLFILGVFLAGALVRRDRSAFTAYAIALAASVAATLINPLGFETYAAVLLTVGHFVQRYITEWQPFTHLMGSPQIIPACVYVVLFAMLEMRGGNTAPAEARILSWFFLVLGAWQLRYLSIFFLFSALPVALHLSRLRWGRLRWFRSNHPADGKQLGAAGFLLLALLPLLYWNVVPAKPGLPQIYPDTELAYLEENFPRARLLNHWNYGGFLILRNRGAIPVFVDGRAATVYPDALLREYFSLISWEVDEAAWKHVLEKYDVDAVMWPKVHKQLAAFLVDKEGWTQVHSGSVANLYVKRAH